MRWHSVMVSMAILLLVPMMSAEGAEKVAASGERYVVVLSEEVGETEAARLASVYGGVLEPDGGHGGRQFVVRMASSRARMMSLDPHVVSVSEQSRHLTPLPTGSGSTTLDPYAYDGSGNVKSIGPAGNQEQYVYDALGRLTSATAGVTNTQTYQYDAFGNRTVVNRTGSNCTGNTACEQQGTYLAETNHLDNNGAVYDAAGNLTAYVADRYAYDAAGMLARALVSGADRQYLYTAFDERMAVYDGTFNWRWTVRSEDGKVLREFTSTNDLSTGALGVGSRQWVKDYVWRNGQLLATENRKAGGGTVTEHYHLDHLGTPRLVTDGTGLKLATHTYYAFGAELMGTPESPEAGMKFTGHERDITGNSDALDNMHARYYSALTGRFLSVDPVTGDAESPQSWNRYAYVRNNPINAIDPDGRLILCVGGCWDSLKRGASTAAHYLKSAIDRAAPIVALGGAVIDGAKMLEMAGPQVAIETVEAESTEIAAAESSEAEAAVESAAPTKVSTLSPGPHADESVQARGPQPKFTPQERASMNRIGAETGCHTCGATSPGTKSGNFVPDHQPPSAINPNNQKLFPHCIGCSRKQGGEVLQFILNALSSMF
jgi:RHS repeat-associated protein